MSAGKRALELSEEEEDGDAGVISKRIKQHKEPREVAPGLTRLLRQLAFGDSKVEPDSRKEVRMALRDSLPHAAFPSPVLNLILEYLQRNLLCEIRTESNGRVTNLVVSELGSQPGAFSVIGPIALTGGWGLPYFGTAQIYADENKSALFAFFSIGVVCKFDLGGPIVTYIKRDLGFALGEMLMPENKMDGSYHVFALNRFVELDAELLATRVCPLYSTCVLVILPVPERRTRLFLCDPRSASVASKLVSPFGDVYDFGTPVKEFNKTYAWTSKTRILFTVAQQALGPDWIFRWNRIEFCEKEPLRVNYVSDLLTVTGSNKPYLLTGCISLPCDGTATVSSTLLVYASVMVWAKLRWDERSHKWVESVQSIPIEKPGYAAELTSPLTSDIIAVRMTKIEKLAGAPERVLLLVALVQPVRADEEETIEILAFLEDDFSGEFTNTVLIRTWR